MNAPERRRGFALIELPLVLLVVALLGLAIVGAVHFFSGSVSWYWWFLGFITPPSALIAIGAFNTRKTKHNE